MKTKHIYNIWKCHLPKFGVACNESMMCFASELLGCIIEFWFGISATVVFWLYRSKRNMVWQFNGILIPTLPRKWCALSVERVQSLAKMSNYFSNVTHPIIGKNSPFHCNANFYVTLDCKKCYFCVLGGWKPQCNLWGILSSGKIALCKLYWHYSGNWFVVGNE